MVTLSVVLFVLLLLPLIRAISNKIKTAPPTIHTHGCVYQSCVSVVVVWVVVVVADVEALSCAHTIACVSVSIIIRNRYLKDPCLNNFFIVMFLVNE